LSKATKCHCAGTVWGITRGKTGRVGNVKQVGFEPRPEDSYGRCGSDKHDTHDDRKTGGEKNYRRRCGCCVAVVL